MFVNLSREGYRANNSVENDQDSVGVNVTQVGNFTEALYEYARFRCSSS